MRANLRGAARPEIRVQRDALDRRLRVQLKGQPRDLDEILLLQLFDSYRVDVAPGSNVVGKQDQLDRLASNSHLQIDNREIGSTIPAPRGQPL
jgi:hypothetical protein